MKTLKLFVPVFALVALASISASAQLLSQSELTKADVDADFKLTLDHLSYDSRWLGLSPRGVTWSADGQTVYFRWRDDPASGQNPDTDPWYAVNRAGTRVRVVDTEEVRRIPSGNISWSVDRSVAAWARSGTLFLWNRGRGARAVYTAASSLGNLQTAPDGSRVFFSAEGFGGTSPESSNNQSSDLWAYDVDGGHVRQLAAVSEKEEDPSDKEHVKWLEDQQLELIEIVRQRKSDREESDALSREREPFRPQVIPIEKGARAYNIRLSPDGRYITFQWMKRASDGQRTSFLEFVNESGQATEKEARPKVGDPVPEYKMGIVRVDPLIDTEDVEITWVDAGVETETVVHGPYWSPAGDGVVVQILSMDHKDRWISSLDVATGQVTPVHHEHQDEWIGGPLVGGRWNPGYLQWLDDGSAFGFVTEETGWTMLNLADADGNVTRLTDGEFEVRGSVLGADGNWYLTTSREHPGEIHLYRLGAGGELERITMGEGRNSATLSPDGQRIAVLYQSTLDSADLYLQDNRPRAEQQRITKAGTDDYYRYETIITATIGSTVRSSAFPMVRARRRGPRFGSGRRTRTLPQSSISTGAASAPRESPKGGRALRVSTPTICTRWATPRRPWITEAARGTAMPTAPTRTARWGFPTWTAGWRCWIFSWTGTASIVNESAFTAVPTEGSLRSCRCSGIPASGRREWRCTR